MYAKLLYLLFSYIVFTMLLCLASYWLGIHTADKEVRKAKQDTQIAISELDKAKEKISEANEAAEVIFMQARKCMRRK